MAVIYTPSGQDSLTIGGTASTGPFPSYSIKRSITPSQDGTVVNNKYTITVKGTFIVPSSIDITESGAKQSAVHAKIIEKLQIGIQNNHNFGRLEIVPYGGQPNAFDFIDARLVDVDIPEPNPASAHNTTFEYTLTFEASIDASNRTPDILYLVDSIEESWSISLGQNVTSSPSIVSETEFDKTYNITHTVSATGRRRLDNSGNFDKSSWFEAKKWVTSRLVDSPASLIIEDFFGGDEFTTFLPRSFSDTDETTLINLNDYQFYNHIRIPQAGLTAGTYSVTETWDASPFPAVLNMEVSLEEDGNGVVTANINGSIDGFNVNGSQNRKIKKYDSASMFFNSFEANVYNIANHYFSQEYSTPLRRYPKSKNIGRNVTGGVITFSYSFDDTPELIQNTISSNLTISDNNELKNIQVVAIIPIIARRLGPIIQNMNTTKESTRTVAFSCVMQREHRDIKPSEARDLVLSYAPVSEAVYLQDIDDEWNPVDGSYSLTANWVY